MSQEIRSEDRSVGRSQDDSSRYQPLDGMAFEEALTELEDIVQQLEQGSSRLEESIVAYERGETLKVHCERLLARAQGQVEKITRVADKDKDSNTSDATDQSNQQDSVQADSVQADSVQSADGQTDGEQTISANDGQSFVREQMAISTGDLVSSLARRG